MSLSGVTHIDGDVDLLDFSLQRHPISVSVHKTRHLSVQLSRRQRVLLKIWVSIVLIC